jgi:uncharacterized membrane protein HdeD (DUF308 family)
MANSDAEVKEAASKLHGYYWVWLVTGVLWVVVSLVVLQFNTTSLTTVGIIIGAMVLFAGFQQFAMAALAESWKWVYIIFGVLFTIAGILALAYPKNTFAAVADMLGFVFLLVAVFWIVEAFAVRSAYPLWWLNLVAGILMLGIAFWTAGQFFSTKAYTLIAFAGVWAMFHGLTDIVRAFEVRKLDGSA